MDKIDLTKLDQEDYGSDVLQQIDSDATDSEDKIKALKESRDVTAPNGTIKKSVVPDGDGRISQHWHGAPSAKIPEGYRHEATRVQHCSPTEMRSNMCRLRKPVLALRCPICIHEGGDAMLRGGIAIQVAPLVRKR